MLGIIAGVSQLIASAAGKQKPSPLVGNTKASERLYIEFNCFLVRISLIITVLNLGTNLWFKCSKLEFIIFICFLNSAVSFLKNTKKEKRLEKYKALLKFRNITYEADLFTWHNSDIL